MSHCTVYWWIVPLGVLGGEKKTSSSEPETTATLSSTGIAGIVAGSAAATAVYAPGPRAENARARA